MALRGLTPLALFFLGSVAAVGCGGATDTDFSSDDDSVGGSAGEDGNGGSSQGGSSEGGSSQGGASGSTGAGGSGQGGNDPNGGSSTGGTPNGGASGTGTGGATTGGSAGTSPGGGSGGSAGGSGGTASGGAPLGGTGGLPSDCARTIAEAQAALTSAQVCDPNTDGPKCTGKVEDLCGCVVPVNDLASELTETYLELREAALKCNPICLEIVCREPTAVMCGIGGVTTNIIGVRAQCGYAPR